MAVGSNFEIINNTLRVATREQIAQDIDKFNASSRNMLQLSVAPLAGDVAREVFNTRLAGLIEERDPRVDTAVTALDLSTNSRSWIKVNRRVRTVNLNPQQYTLMLEDPYKGALEVQAQVPENIMQDMLNVAIGVVTAALAQTSAVVYDGVTNEANKKLTQRKFGKAAALFGDMSDELAGWLMHSTPYHDLFDNQINNGENLFTAGNVRVTTDLMGRPIIMTDSPNLINLTPNPDHYRVLGLTAGAVEVQMNDDMFSNLQTVNGFTNIKATLQSEYSFNLRVKGYSWDTTNGGVSPTNAALYTSANWDKWVASNKFGPGVILNVE